MSILSINTSLAVNNLLALSVYQPKDRPEVLTTLLEQKNTIEIEDPRFTDTLYDVLRADAIRILNRKLDNGVKVASYKMRDGKDDNGNPHIIQATPAGIWVRVQVDGVVVIDRFYAELFLTKKTSSKGNLYTALVWTKFLNVLNLLKGKLYEVGYKSLTAQIEPELAKLAEAKEAAAKLRTLKSKKVELTKLQKKIELEKTNYAQEHELS